jgi:hypothetical protein
MNPEVFKIQSYKKYKNKFNKCNQNIINNLMNMKKNKNA